MRRAHLLAPLVLLIACRKGAPPRADAAPPTFCAWALDANNCWHAFVRSVDRCLGEARGPGVMRDGICVYDAGRSVAFAKPFTPGDTIARDIDLRVRAAGSECLHLVRDPKTRSFTATSPAGTVSLRDGERDAKGEGSTFTCADGRSVRYTEEQILSCGLPEPEIEAKLPGLQIRDELHSTTITMASRPVLHCEAR